MKTVRVIAAIVLLACAAFAAYLSYVTAFAPPPMHSASARPPAGVTMPRGNSAAKPVGANPSARNNPDGNHRDGDTPGNNERRKVP